MGLDVYVGSLTRYYARDWETVIQKFARETGMTLEVLRPNEEPDAIVDPEIIRSAVRTWRDNLTRGLGNNIAEPLDWDESAGSPYFTDKPAWDCYSSLLLWAAYQEHQDLVRPAACIEDWTTDEAYRRSSGGEFQTKCPTLLGDTEIWLPADFKFIFAAPDVSGNKVNFGSVKTLRDELAHLNARTWRADSTTLAAWRREGAEHLAPLEICARFAFAILYDLACAATENRLVMKLDY